MPDFLPGGNSDFADWARNAAVVFAGTPGAYAMTPAEAGQIAAEVAEYRSRLAVATAQATRTQPSVRAAASARAALERRLRRAVIRLRPRATPADLARLGLRPTSLNRRRTPAPQTVPHLSITALSRDHLGLLARDSQSPRRVAKPPGVGCFDVRYAAEPLASADPAEWPHLGFAGRTRCQFRPQSPLPGGVRVHFAARWVAPSHAGGPFGPPVDAVVPIEGTLSWAA